MTDLHELFVTLNLKYYFILHLQIDALSKRSKASETAFLSIYKKLVDVPGIIMYSVIGCTVVHKYFSDN